MSDEIISYGQAFRQMLYEYRKTFLIIAMVPPILLLGAMPLILAMILDIISIDLIDNEDDAISAIWPISAVGLLTGTIFITVLHFAGDTETRTSILWFWAICGGAVVTIIGGLAVFFISMIISIIVFALITLPIEFYQALTRRTGRPVPAWTEIGTKILTWVCILAWLEK